MNILAITGATGRKSGGAFVEELCRHEDEIRSKFAGGIRALVRPSSKTENLKNRELAFDVRAGDFSDVAFLESALNGVDTLVHIAGITLSPKLVDAAAKCGVRRLIFVHTTGIYSKYKEAGEEYRRIDTYVKKKCRDHHMMLTILRPTMIYGNVTDRNVVQFIQMVDRLPVMPVVNGARYELQPVHYQDLAAAYYQVLINEKTTANKNFDLSGGAPIELREMLITIGNDLGKKVKFINCPFCLAYTGAWMIYLITLRKKDYREKVQRLCEPRVYSHQDAADAFGYSPRIFEIGVADEIKEYISLR